MLVDKFDRKIDYLRISVTDRCNYRCTYCMPESGVSLKSHESILSFEDITAIAEEAAELGIEKIRLTGGEPLVRKNVGVLVAMLGRIEKINDLTMTTNAVFLSGESARELRDAGLTRINISLDTLDPGRFKEITRGGDINDVLGGIEAARKAGFDKIKINMIIFSETTPEEVESMRTFCDDRGLVLQTIKHFSLYNRDEMVGDVDIFDRPAPCSGCNRIRLTADGFLKPCLFSDDEIRIDMDDIKGSLLKAVEGKPLQGTSCCNRSMYQIGG